MLGKLGGYHERMHVDHEHRHLLEIHELSDMELMQRLHEVMQKLGIESDHIPGRNYLPASSLSACAQASARLLLEVSLPGILAQPAFSTKDLRVHFEVTPTSS